MALLRRVKGLSEEAVISRVKYLMDIRSGERTKLDEVRRYWKGVQGLPTLIPSTSPYQVRTMAQIARVNICAIVVDSLAQATFVDNFRSTEEESGDDLEVWELWQANKMDARQSGIHRATFAYGTAYAVVVPGDPFPVIRGVSPRQLTAVYGDDPDWPEMAMERYNGTWRLYDNQNTYILSGDPSGSGEKMMLLGTVSHNAGVVPVIRYLDEFDLDREDDVEPTQYTISNQGEALRNTLMSGQVSPLMPVQDQIDLTTFSLLVAQWYTSFRQRYAIGWVPEDEMDKLKASASTLWTFDKLPSEMQLGEFEQTDLGGFIDSRTESIRHASSLSQTPAHELIGEIVNISAEALAAAEAGHERKVGERKTILGESHEQMLRLAGKMAGIEVPIDAQVGWRETSTRSLSATVDALGKLAELLGIPQEELWEKVPNATKQDVERWKAAKAAMPPEVEDMPATVPADMPMDSGAA